jgi:hypothetical protein
MAISPAYYREARMDAPHHIQGKILARRPNGARVKVVRIFRGPLWYGTILDLSFRFPSLEPPKPGDPLCSNPHEFQAARFVEAFLEGDPPDVVLEQVKFLRSATWRPTGDITLESYGW